MRAKRLVKEGDSLEDSTGLVVRVERIDADKRVHFSVMKAQERSAGPGTMSYETFVHRFWKHNREPQLRAA